MWTRLTGVIWQYLQILNLHVTSETNIMYIDYISIFKMSNNEKRKKKRKLLCLRPTPGWSYLFGLALLRISGLDPVSGIFHPLSSLFFLLYNQVLPSLESYLWFLRRAVVMLQCQLLRLSGLKEQRFTSSDTACPPALGQGRPPWHRNSRMQVGSLSSLWNVVSRGIRGRGHSDSKTGN